MDNFVFWTTISDLLVDLSASWFGAAFIIPITTRHIGRISWWLLTVNFVFAIVILIVTLWIRSDKL